MARCTPTGRIPNPILNKTLTVGKYLVSPLVRRTAAGTYSAAVSIRSGRGTGTHDRIFRFIPQFNSHESAECFALAEGIGWTRGSPAA